MMQKRYTNIDILRIPLSLIIVIYHYFFKYKTFFFGENQSKLLGEIGVAGFLIISGFFLFPQRLSPTPKGNNHLNKMCFPGIEYFRKRIVNLWPKYIICIIFTFVFTRFFPLEGRTVSYIHLFFNCIFLNGYLNIPYVDAAHWYITVLISSYLIVSIILSISKSNKLKSIMLWLAINFFLHLLDNWCSYRYLSLIIKEMILLTGGDYVAFFVIGYCISTWRNNISNAVTYDKTIMEILCGLLSLLYIVVVHDVEYFVVSVVMALLILMLVSIKQFHERGKRKLRFLSDSTLFLYLLHQNVGYAMITYMLNKGLNYTISCIITILFACGLALAFNYLFVFCVRLKRNRRKKIESACS